MGPGAAAQQTLAEFVERDLEQQLSKPLLSWWKEHQAEDLKVLILFLGQQSLHLFIQACYSTYEYNLKNKEKRVS